MSAFNTKVELQCIPSVITLIAEQIEKEFTSDGFQTKRDTLLSGGEEIFITKGGMFKEVLGMRTALKIILIPNSNSVDFEAGIGIFGQQFIPTVISMFFFWPVLLTQIWGLVKQAKLDDRALAIAQSIIAKSPNQRSSNKNFQFCTNCGTRVAMSDKFCPNCGAKF